MIDNLALYGNQCALALEGLGRRRFLELHTRLERREAERKRESG